MAITSPFQTGSKESPSGFSREAVLRDYRIGYRSRQFSVIARREVLTGKAKFGIFGDGKEVAQLALAYAFKRGDFRSGYYRDQTLMLALELVTLEEMFAQLYAHADLEAEPAFGGRAMTGHFATRLIDRQGRWREQIALYNSSADLSPTASQMPRLIGLAYASKLYRKAPALAEISKQFTNGGNEVAFGTIGNASCAEGLFWESVNAAGVLQIPMLLSIWDDGYGISVPNQFQMTKGDITRVLEGFRRRQGGRPGIDIYTVQGWDYPALCACYIQAVGSVRRDHIPAIIHVTEVTQPLGHSTSGSHERYKPPERLEWEKEYDCLRKMRAWLIAQEFATAPELDALEQIETKLVLECKDKAWNAFRASIEEERKTVLHLTSKIAMRSSSRDQVEAVGRTLNQNPHPNRRDLLAAAAEVLILARTEHSQDRSDLAAWKRAREEENNLRYGSDLYSESEQSALRVQAVPAVYSESSPLLSGFEILNACFDAAFARYPNLIAMGEDVGQLGDVNQGFAHLQKKYGELRVTDTGIREATIIGQAIGMALRGLRPIAEVQYLDYILYALQIMSDDLASLRWRTRGGQKAPVILRTRGHRLEGIWHSGSPMAGVLNLIRGIYVCVPRDSTQAAGFYNTLLRSDDAALIVEVLNGYRKKAKLPDNIGSMTIPLGVPEILRPGRDVTVVTYGACCAIAEEAAGLLQQVGIEIELIDVRTLLPFDLNGVIGESLRKTNRILFLDEDFPGGATAFMLQQVLEKQRGYRWLDSEPRTLSAKEHRPAYGSDGDYFSKPNREQIFETVYEIMHEASPERYPLFHR